MNAYLRAVGLFSTLAVAGTTLVLGQQSSNTQTQLAGATATITVTDHDHRPITGLTAENFTLYLDGQKQAISSVTSGDVPACAGLLIDQSGSMRGKHTAIAAAMGDFVRAGNPGNQYFVVLFSDDALLQEDFTRDAAAIEQAISAANARGGTGFYEAVIASADHLAERKNCAKRVLVLVSDGLDNESRSTLEQTVRALNEDGNPLVYAIGLPERTSVSGKGKHALEQLTTPGGGTAIILGDFGDMRKAARRIAEELHSQYSLVYPPNATGNPQLKINAHAPGGKALAVRINIAREPVVRAKAVAAPSPSAPASASQAPAPLPTPAVALRGTGCISGSVVDQNKKPVAGMNVEAWPVFADNTYSKDSYPQVTTDEKGNFKFPELQEGPYQLYTKNESAGYPPTKDPFYRNGANNWSEATRKCANVVIAVGPRAVRLKVSAIDEVTHEPIARFGFSLRSSHGILSFRWATPEMEVLVPPNTELGVSGWSPPRYLRTEPVTFVTTGPDSSQEITVKLSPRTAASSNMDK